MPLTVSPVIQWLTLSLNICFVGIGIGVGVYIEARLPKTPLDGLMVAMHNVFGWSLQNALLLIEGIGALIGFCWADQLAWARC